MHLSLFAQLALLCPVALAQIGNGCTGSGGLPGVCDTMSSCNSVGGTSIAGACPNTPDDVQCCTKSPCAAGGTCRFDSSCTTKHFIGGICPGPSDFRCCLPAMVNVTGDLGEQVLAKAKYAEGIDYLWVGGSCNGAQGGGFDCSGLVSWAICQITGRNLFNEGLRNTAQMYCATEAKRKYKKVPYPERRAGDLVFFGGNCDCTNGPEASNVHHVGVMMNSETLMWNALKTGTKVRADDFGNWTEKACDHVIRLSSCGQSQQTRVRA